MRVLTILALVAGAAGCGKAAGLDDTEILQPYASLSGGVVFATRAIQASNGYDLYVTPIPAAGDIGSQPAFRLTEAQGNEWQPSVSPGGNGIAFARSDDGIFLINRNGRVRQISDTDGTRFVDSLPAVSFDGQLVAWVREDLNQAIGDTGFSQAYIMVANADGSDPRILIEKEGFVQDAPRFEPMDRSYRLVWSEFDARTLSGSGPTSYGIWLHDPITKMGSYVCQAPGVAVGQTVYRCFGQHIAWPIPGTVILPQNGLEFSLTGGPPDNVQARLVESISTQQVGFPVVEQVGGFHRTFPVSAGYFRNEVMVIDGLITDVNGDLPTLGFFMASVDGATVQRLFVAGLSNDYDPNNTAGYLFSVATPQIIP
ncbi:MAG: hypothetical protein RIT81_44065 [Deltaproteobacteria bacterium]